MMQLIVPPQAICFAFTSKKKMYITHEVMIHENSDFWNAGRIIEKAPDVSRLI